MMEAGATEFEQEMNSEEPSGIFRTRRTLCPTSRGKIVGRHPTLVRALDTIERVANSHCTVLVTGESGTGKELFVAALHDASPRRSRELVTINCGAIPENLIESELFGHAKGAFTGAHTARQGRVALAEKGTLFLDEVGELPLTMQTKLLRLLQQREYSPVGESRTIKCDIRVVAATNRDLEAEVAKGRFREDLYYRLNVIQLQLPSLRERADDVGELAMHFFEDCRANACRSDLIGITPEALLALRNHSWPGNIRSLRNCVERAVLLSVGPWITIDDLPESVSRSSRVVRAAPPSPPEATKSPSIPVGGLDLRRAVEEYENQLITKALERTGRNKNKAAQLLGVNRTTLVEMVKRKGL